MQVVDRRCHVLHRRLLADRLSRDRRQRRGVEHRRRDVDRRLNDVAEALVQVLEQHARDVLALLRHGRGRRRRPEVAQVQVHGQNERDRDVLALHDASPVCGRAQQRDDVAQDGDAARLLLACLTQPHEPLLPLARRVALAAHELVKGLGAAADDRRRHVGEARRHEE